MANKYAEFSKQDEARKELFRRVHGPHKNKLSCIRKTPYDTKEHALRRAKAKSMDGKLYAYKCGFCHYWHLTKQEQYRHQSYVH